MKTAQISDNTMDTKDITATEEPSVTSEDTLLQRFQRYLNELHAEEQIFKWVVYANAFYERVQRILRSLDQSHAEEQKRNARIERLALINHMFGGHPNKWIENTSGGRVEGVIDVNRQLDELSQQLKRSKQKAVTAFNDRKQERDKKMSELRKKKEELTKTLESLQRSYRQIEQEHLACVKWYSSEVARTSSDGHSCCPDM